MAPFSVRTSLLVGRRHETLSISELQRSCTQSACKPLIKGLPVFVRGSVGVEVTVHLCTRRMPLLDSFSVWVWSVLIACHSCVNRGAPVTSPNRMVLFGLTNFACEDIGCPVRSHVVKGLRSQQAERDWTGTGHM